ncbi:MAG: hypothetical protein PVJ80_04550 [Gemmatimonadota bacterium]|jgi:hypothetical protein
MGDTQLLLPLFEWFEASPPGQMVQESLWMFPVLEAFHLVGLAILGGALLVVDLRLMGVGLRDSTIRDIDRQARPWLAFAVILLLVTGTMLFMSEAVKCYYNTSFWVKMMTLPVAIVFTFFVKERFAKNALYTSAYSQWIAGADLLLWFIVAAGGRWIGFS